MRQAQITYKSGHTVKINFVGKININYRGDELTNFKIDHRVSGAEPLLWNLSEVESVVLQSVGWQRVAEYLVGLVSRTRLLFGGD